MRIQADSCLNFNDPPPIADSGGHLPKTAWLCQAVLFGASLQMNELISRLLGYSHANLSFLETASDQAVDKA